MPEEDAIVIHLVRDDDRTRTACTNTPYSPTEPDEHTLIILCSNCYHIALKQVNENTVKHEGS